MTHRTRANRAFWPLYSQAPHAASPSRRHRTPWLFRARFRSWESCAELPATMRCASGEMVTEATGGAADVGMVGSSAQAPGFAFSYAREHCLRLRGVLPRSHGPGYMGSPAHDPIPSNELQIGRRDTLDRLMPEVYDELRAIARRQLSGREGGGTLSTTGLVHEAYLKLVDQSRIAWRDRAHFFALASVAMRHVLVDRARARLAQKREGELHRITLDSEVIAAPDQPDAMLQLSEAIDRLAQVEPRLARVVDCRFFGGMSDEDIAEALEVTTRTVQRDWAKARMLLRRALAP